MYQQMTYHRRPRRASSYFLPFLSLIILGLIVVLIFQIVQYFQEKRAQALENKAAVKIITGKAEMKIWGVDQWTTALDGSVLNEGDTLRTEPGSRVILALLNGSVARLSSDTEIELTDLKTKDGQDEAAFSLKKGELWVKRTEKPTVRTSFKVTTPHLDVSSLGTIFDMRNTDREAIDVLDGKVQLAVNVEDDSSDTSNGKAAKMRTAETFEVALGQEVSIGQDEVTALKNRKPINLLAVLADDFRNAEWYTWNHSQDSSSSGGQSMSVADAVQQQQQNGTSAPATTLPGVTPDSTTTTPPAAPPAQEISAVLTAPVIITPKESDRTTKTGTVFVTGTVSTQTQKLEVTTFIGGKPEPYVLQKYLSGSEQWSYVASNSYANLVPGENRYTFVAIAKDGTRSSPTELSILYDVPKQPADLSAPIVHTFNGSTSSEVQSDEVKVEGAIGKGIVKIFVNDAALSRYVPDSQQWVYYAKTSYKNLKEGENKYSIYGVDADGNKTPLTNFTITKSPPLTAPTPAPTPSPTPAPLSGVPAPPPAPNPPL